MSISDLELVRHIYEEVEFVLSATLNKSKDEVFSDKILCRAIERSLEIIGEASKRLSDDFRSAQPSIEWRKMAGTRDRLIHHYFGVDYDIIWDIIMTKLPPLQDQLRIVLQSL